MEIRPILASLHKHRIPALLIVLEIALACAVLCNAVFMIAGCLISTRISTGIDEQGLSVIHIGGLSDAHGADSVARDLTTLRGVAGVQAVAAIKKSRPTDPRTMRMVSSTGMSDSRRMPDGNQ